MQNNISERRANSMEQYMKALRDNLNYIMGMEEYTNAEMAERCGISKRKLEEIIYLEDKGIHFSTLCRISESTGISIAALITNERGNMAQIVNIIHARTKEQQEYAAVI